MPRRVVLHRRPKPTPRNLNRMAAVLKPKQPMLDWLQASPGWDHPLTLAELRGDECLVLLTPDFDFVSDSRRYVEQHFRQVFELELGGWFQDPALWPKPLTLRLFREWFDIELHSMLIDLTTAPYETELLWA